MNKLYDIIEIIISFVKISMVPSFNIFGIGFKPKSYLGIDVGTLSIKAVELTVEGGRPKLENYGILSNYGLAADSSAQGAQIQQSQKAFGGQAAAMIRRLLKEAGI